MKLFLKFHAQVAMMDISKFQELVIYYKIVYSNNKENVLNVMMDIF